MTIFVHPLHLPLDLPLRHVRFDIEMEANRHNITDITILTRWERFGSLSLNPLSIYVFIDTSRDHQNCKANTQSNKSLRKYCSSWFEQICAKLHHKRSIFIFLQYNNKRFRLEKNLYSEHCLTFERSLRYSRNS